MAGTRPPWYLRETVDLLRRAVDVLDTARAPRRRLEGAFQELMPLEFDELSQGRLSAEFLALRGAMLRVPEGDDGTLAASVAAMSDTEVQEEMDRIRALYVAARHEWDAARGKG